MYIADDKSIESVEGDRDFMMPTPACYSVSTKSDKWLCHGFMVALVEKPVSGYLGL